MTGVLYFPSANTLLTSDTRYAHTADRSDISLARTRKHRQNVSRRRQRPLNKTKQKKEPPPPHPPTQNVRLGLEDGVEQTVPPALLGATPVVHVLDDVRQLRLQDRTVHPGLQEGRPFFLQRPLASHVPLRTAGKKNKKRA